MINRNFIFLSPDLYAWVSIFNGSSVIIRSGKPNPRDMSHFKASGTFYKNALEIGKELILSKEGFPTLSGKQEHMKSIEISNINELLTSDIERAKLLMFSCWI